MPELVSKVKRALPIAESRIGVGVRDDFSIYFDTDPDTHNGLATVIPTNRILVQTEPPLIEDSIGLSTDYLGETLVHEIGHMISIQSRAGVFSVASGIFGTASRPVGLWPRWIHEGTAVWTESALGGRSGSGYIDFELRRFAESYRRRKKFPLSSSDLDGQSKNERVNEKVEEGSVPYHFGYLMVAAMNEKVPWKEFLPASSENLGSSFRAVYRSLAGESLDALFERERARWAATPLPDPPVPLPAPIGEAPILLGPFANEFATTWIERGDTASDTHLVARAPGGEPRRVPWRRRYASPISVYAAHDGGWIAFARSPDPEVSRPARRRIYRLRADGRAICAFPAGERLRELDVREGRLSWTRSYPNGHMVIEQATLPAAGCELHDVRTLARSRHGFERLSTPRGLATGSVAYARSEGWNSFREFLELPEGRLRGPMPLAAPSPLPKEACGAEASECWLAQRMDKIYWGPVLLARDAHDGWSLRELPLATGSSHSVPVPGDASRIFVRESLWEKDLLHEYPVTAFRPASAPVALSFEPRPAADPPPAPRPPPTVEEVPHPYSPRSTFFPSFWIPMLAAAPGGLLVMGQTFTEDVTAHWGGTAALGYDSSIQKPFANLQLQRRKIEGAFFPAVTMGASFEPAYNYVAQTGESRGLNRWGANFSASASRLLPHDWLLLLTPQVRYFGSQKTSNLRSFQALVPSLSWTLSSPDGRRPNSPVRVSAIEEPGFYLSQNFGAVEGPFASQAVVGQIPLAGSLLESTAQYGWTDTRNFPAVYFEWGGLPSLSTQTENYLSRGFRPRMAAGSAVLRTAVSWSFKLLEPHAALSWNRLRLDAIDARAIFESVSFTSFPPRPGLDSRFHVGDQFFSSVGGEVDFWSSTLHYVNFVATAGLFHGFGRYGDTRVTILLRSWLDL